MVGQEGAGALHISALWPAIRQIHPLQPHLNGPTGAEQRGRRRGKLRNKCCDPTAQRPAPPGWRDKSGPTGAGSAPAGRPDVARALERGAWARNQSQEKARQRRPSSGACYRAWPPLCSWQLTSGLLEARRRQCGRGLATAGVQLFPGRRQLVAAGAALVGGEVEKSGPGSGPICIRLCSLVWQREISHVSSRDATQTLELARVH